MNLLPRLRAGLFEVNMTDTVRALQKEIREWADSVFPHRTKESILKKFDEELVEWREAPDDPLEYADLVILILDFASLSNIDVQSAVRDKIDINYNREWVINKNGIMRHTNHDLDKETP